MNRFPLMTLLLSVPLLQVSLAQAGLPDDLQSTFQEIADSFSGDWGFGVIDFSTGETASFNSTRRFSMEIPHVPLTALAIELSNSGDMPLDNLIGRNEYFWERLHWAQQGGRGMCMALIWSIGEGRINDWISANGYSGTEINGVIQDYPNCPAYDPNLISVSDAISYLDIIYSNMDQVSVRKIGSNPPFSDHIRETLGFSSKVYGWIDVSSDSKDLFMIIEPESGSDMGIVILTDGLDDVSNTDRGFRMLYEALK